MNDKKDQLTLVVENSGLAPNAVENLLKQFSAYFNEAKKIAEESKGIVVTDETQTELMSKAREKRLSLKSLRNHVEQVRVQLKEQSLREGRAIDGVSNLIKALIVPVEEHLEKQEKFAEIRELERIQKQYEDRISKLTPYVDDITLYNIKDMSDEAFSNLLESSQKATQAKKDAEAKAEADRVANEARVSKFNDRRYELAPYKEFLNPDFLLTIDTTEIDYLSALKTGKEAKKKHDDEQEKIRKENEELRKKNEQAEKAKKEAEDKLKDEKEKKEREDREAKEAEEEKQRIALLAPDKEKLIELAGVIDKIQLPAVSSHEAGVVLEAVQTGISKISTYLRDKAKTL